MQHWCGGGPRARPWIAVVASYALALQAILAGIATSLSPAEHLFAQARFVICSASADGAAGDNSGRPPSHDAACALLCAMAAGSPALTSAGIPHHFVPTVHVAHAALAAAVISFPRRFSPRQSQGPPRTA
jgi:hypothetical protein